MAVQVSWYDIEKVFAVYDSNNPAIQVEFTREEFIQFLKAIKNGELDAALAKQDPPER